MEPAQILEIGRMRMQIEHAGHRCKQNGCRAMELLNESSSSATAAVVAAAPGHPVSRIISHPVLRIAALHTCWAHVLVDAAPC